jgi:hypothetical protein
MMINQASGCPSDQFRIALTGAVSGVTSTAVMGFLWKEHPFFAAVGVALYVMGGVRVFPWKTPLRKAISIGIFVGIAVSSALFYWDFL